jgi:hypothetical protein
MMYKKAKVTFSQIGGSAIQFDLAASEKDPRFLVFKNAILARAEVNANHDEIFPEGIAELAGTIAGCPINDEHSDQFVGAFTAGRPQDNALSVDGFIWAVRWPDLADAVKDGRKGLSIEASAEKIVCSKCGQEYDKETGKSCPHIMSRRSKQIHGATRQLHGLTAMGGATTYTPAGTGAQFSNQIYMVASKEGTDNLICGYCEEDVSPGEDGICPQCGWDIVGEISKREDVNPKEGEKEYGDVKFADEKNKKYPIDTAAHVRAAFSYLSMPKNAAKYSDSEVATIKRKIIAAWKKLIDKEGPPSAKVESSMDEKEKAEAKEAEVKDEEKKEAEEEKKEEKEEPEAKASVDFQAEIDKLTAALAEAKANYEKVTKELEDERTARAEVEARYTARVLASLLEGDELTKAVEKAKGMSLDQIDLLASVSGKQKPTKAGLNFLDLSGGAESQPTKIKLTL